MLLEAWLFFQQTSSFPPLCTTFSEDILNVVQPGP